MRLRLLPALLIGIALATASPATSFAAGASFDCTGGCMSSTYWNGIQYGALVQTTVSSPPLSNGDAVWDRFLQVKQQTSGSANSVYAGIEKCGTGPCNQAFCGHPGLQYFVATKDSAGQNERISCWPVPSADVNQPVNFGIVPYSGGYGLSITLQNTGVVYSDQWPFADGAPASFGRVQYIESIKDTVKGHEVWGSLWRYSAHLHADGLWSYQFRKADSLSSRNPPQMYWSPDAGPGNNGGVLVSCVYESGGGCTLNG